MGIGHVHIRLGTAFSMIRSGACAGGLHRSLHNGAGDNSKWFRISPAVRDAIAEQEPVVALESAIITHGMPAPHNTELALDMEARLRRKGVLPATVGVLKGQLVVGLSSDEIESLGRNRNSSEPMSSNQIVKVSRRDLPFVMANGLDGGTTVSGTIIGAKLAGIPIFATGGLGGVHRGAGESFDVSADLRELGRSSIAIVSAGIKSILDIGKTLEYLETEGVCVVVMKPAGSSSSSTRFPSFFTSESQFEAPYSVADEVEGARLIAAARDFGLESGILIAVPIPKEFEASGLRIESAIQSALKRAAELDIAGRALTPFLLGEINATTRGESLEANKRLVENNVDVAGNIALELAKLKKGGSNQRANVRDSDEAEPSFDANCTGPLGVTGMTGGMTSSSTFNPQTVLHASVISKFKEPEPQLESPESESGCAIIENMVLELPTSSKRGPPVVIGGSSLDLVLAVEEPQIVQDGRTHTARIRTTPGGVARNVAEALARLGKAPVLISAVGADPFGHQILDNAEEAGINTDAILVAKNSEQTPTTTTTTTAIYSAILTASGECLFGLGDMNMHERVDPALITRHASIITSAPLVILDTNVPAATLSAVLQLCSANSIPVWLEPTELRKVRKLLSTPPQFWSCIQFMSPNMAELMSLTGAGAGGEGGVNPTNNLPSHARIAACFDKFPGLRLIMLTKGKKGFTLFSRSPEAHLSFPAPVLKSTDILRSVSGAGDCLNAGFIAGLLEGQTLGECAARGTEASKKSLLSTSNVPTSFK